MMQPWLTSEWRASASGPSFAGERSSERVWISQLRSKRSSGGTSPTRSRLAFQYASIVPTSRQ